MNSEATQVDHGQGSDQDDNGPGVLKHLVQINLDGQNRDVEKGKYLVSALKEHIGVPGDYELDLVESGEFKPLADTAEIKIKGGEVLVSHVRRGGSS